jgi:hypothetical protein
MNKLVQMNMPEFPGYYYTGEFRQVEKFEYYYNHVDDEPEVVQWQNEKHSLSKYPLLKREKALYDFKYNLNAAQVYTPDVMRHISIDFLLKDFRYPVSDETYLGVDGRILEVNPHTVSDFRYPVLILERKQ